MFITHMVKLISVNMNFPDTVQNGVLSFRQIKNSSYLLKCNLEAFRRIKFPSNFPAIRYQTNFICFNIFSKNFIQMGWTFTGNQ